MPNLKLRPKTEMLASFDHSMGMTELGVECIEKRQKLLKRKTVESMIVHILNRHHT